MSHLDLLGLLIGATKLNHSLSISGARTATLTSRRAGYFRRDSDDSDSDTYCEPQTNTFIVVHPSLPNDKVKTLILNTLTLIQRKFESRELDPASSIPNGGFRQLGQNFLTLIVYSQGQNQLTYRILDSALLALQDYFRRAGRTWSTCTFTVWDGLSMVGHGNIH